LSAGFFTFADANVIQSESMKRLFFILLSGCIVACNDNSSFKKAEDAQDAGRQFIRASLDGNYEKARFYLYADSINQFLLDRWKKNYDNLNSDEKNKYRDAEIIVLNIHPLNDSVTTYQYYNTYKKDTTTIRILRINQEWLVDLKEFIKY
jgi:hypothetical protein